MTGYHCTSLLGLQLELTGQSLFDFIHPKDITKVKEQLASSELQNHRLVDAASESARDVLRARSQITKITVNLICLCAAGAQVAADSPVRPSVLTTGARRAFFCRMKHSRVMEKHDDKRLLPGTSKKKGESRCSISSMEKDLVRCGPVYEVDMLLLACL